MVNDLIRRKQLVRLLPKWTGPTQTVYLVYPRRRRQLMQVQVVMEMLGREIQSL